MKYLIIVGGVIALCVFLALFLSLPVWLLWNWLMPTIFGLKAITWLQAWGLLVLCGLLFKDTSAASEKKE